MDDDPQTTGRSADDVARSISLWLSVAITVAEIVWLIDTHAGRQPSRVANHYRSGLTRLRGWARRLAIPSEARRHAPEVVWEAWSLMDEF